MSRTLISEKADFDGVGNPKMLRIKSLHDHGVTVMTDTKVLAVKEEVLPKVLYHNAAKLLGLE